MQPIIKPYLYMLIVFCFFFRNVQFVWGNILAFSGTREAEVSTFREEMVGKKEKKGRESPK